MKVSVRISITVVKIDLCLIGPSNPVLEFLSHIAVLKKNNNSDPLIKCPDMQEAMSFPLHSFPMQTVIYPASAERLAKFLHEKF